ncbi:MAG: WYL domain-containing protein, partial [Dehalococcoidia bacterium]|nr:WYL domain-containing protein [Dehalococcoidia bacterium]
VKLRFSGVPARIARETEWHRSQVTVPEPGGTTTVTLDVPITAELVNFILGWGGDVEVLAPPSLRERIAKTAERVLSIYRKERK